jgi:hypothetical protein
LEFHGSVDALVASGKSADTQWILYWVAPRDCFTAVKKGANRCLWHESNPSRQAFMLIPMLVIRFNTRRSLLVKKESDARHELFRDNISVVKRFYTLQALITIGGSRFTIFS